MVSIENGYVKNTGEWAGKAERQWKQRTTAGRKSKEEMEREKKPTVKVLRLKGEDVDLLL